ncbi:MAG: Glycosyl transferase family 2 [Candidatus Uhrbacteria bacterium GW2011_GWD2_52_7]|uniref:Glycosyl transferase family 2 n=1 Tax=Candidatus Uhrbacteria bacterium GW2011_GWD2_52_7 TaxID=1618989 RepID=A0A0G1XEJ8_9BACT|nr:MAG: Glycosyl transferase family 2 [Candidatus Uhrbacteria bacterium GW2011_GWD2_52_7]
MPDISIVIVVHRESLDVLRACFDAVKVAQGVSYEVFVVDNGANDEYRALVEPMPHATYIRNGKNMGFAYAVNRGMERSTGRYVLLLNPDTVVPGDAMAKMVQHLNEDKDVGIASCIIRYPDGTLQDSIRRFPTPIDQLITLVKLPHVFNRLAPIDRYMMRDADPLKTQDVDSIMGAFMFIRRELLDRIGLLDERYFIWFEEVDYCKMAVDAGFKVRHYADVEIIHHKGHTFNKQSTILKQRWVRTSLRKYLRKHHGLVPWLMFWALTPVFVVLAYVAATIKRH